MPSAVPRRHGGSAVSAVSFATDREPGRLAARSRDTSRAPAAHSSGGARGSQVSRRSLFKDQLVERQVGDGPLEPRILLLQLLQTACLGNLQPAIFLPPTIIALLRYADPSAHLADSLALRQKHVRFTKIVDDLLDRKPLPRHLFCSPSSVIRMPFSNSANGSG